jgi:tetratricopeptide (TPR) repeat protein
MPACRQQFEPRRNAASAIHCAVIFALAVIAGCGELAEAPMTLPVAAEAPPRHGPFYLSTEFLPAPADEGVMQYPLTRELGRQAMLIAARDGLGLATRDETLGDVFPKDFDDSSSPLALSVDPRHGGAGSLVLRVAVAGDAAAAANAELGHYDFKFKSDTFNTYTSMAAAMGAASRDELVDILRRAGYSGESVPEDPDGPLPEGVEPLLADMNFVSQFAAVQTTHAAISEQGESPARLGGLVRGYGHLALLTRHHWSSANAAFAARALLYAERLMALDGGSRLAQQHRAYARALIGLHGMALQDLDRLQPAESDAAASPPVPAWTKVIEPFCRFDEKQLRGLQNEIGLSPLVHQLVFEMKACYFNERWNMVAGREALEECPESYGIFSVMANDSPMAGERWAVQEAAETFGRQIPRRVALLEGLPEKVQDLVRDQTGPRKSWLGKILAGEVSDTAWSPLPSQIARALRDERQASDDTAEPSWQVLASMITEEQFVEVANDLIVSMNAVEFSKQDMVDQFAPLVEGHPYAPYVLCYALDRGRQADEKAKLAAQITVRDPRPNMLPMLYLFWTNLDANSRQFSDSCEEISGEVDYCLPAMLASLADVQDSVWQQPAFLSYYQSIAGIMQWISPHAPNTLRLQLKTTAEPTAEQLADWEKIAQDDPLALVDLAEDYNDRREYEAAIRCYDRSYTLSPTASTAVALATTYRNAGQEDKWLPALEDYLEQEDYALGHAQIHQVIAQDYIEKGKWVDAEPHALAAAQTWSAWGLILAGQVYEGLGRWDESEKWFREATESYPTSSGYEWYLWCRRTGRGDVEPARKYFDQFLKLDTVQRSEPIATYCYIDEMLSGRFQQALKRVQANPEYAEKIYWQTHAALLAKRLGNEQLYVASMDRLMALSDEKERPDLPHLSDVIRAMQKLQREGLLDDASLADVDKRLEEFSPSEKCNFSYYLGEQLALHGHEKQAEAYWRRAMAGSRTNMCTATFAGQRLAEKYGTSSPDAAVSTIDEKDAKDSEADAAAEQPGDDSL